jgi:hypothetical protein
MRERMRERERERGEDIEADYQADKKFGTNRHRERILCRKISK